MTVSACGRCLVVIFFMTLLGVTNVPFVSSMITARDGLLLTLSSREEDVAMSVTYTKKTSNQLLFCACTAVDLRIHERKDLEFLCECGFPIFTQPVVTTNQTNPNSLATPRPLITSL